MRSVAVNYRHGNKSQIVRLSDTYRALDDVRMSQA